jgi:hypothetical protein
LRRYALGELDHPHPASPVFRALNLDNGKV